MWGRIRIPRRSVFGSAGADATAGIRYIARHGVTLTGLFASSENVIWIKGFLKTRKKSKAEF
jgi:hypothetical protein